MRRVNHSRAMRLPRPRSRCRIRQAAFSRQRIPVSAGLRWLTAHLSVHIARKPNVAHAELRGIGVIDGNHGGPRSSPAWTRSRKAIKAMRPLRRRCGFLRGVCTRYGCVTAQKIANNCAELRIIAISGAKEVRRNYSQFLARSWRVE